MGAIGIVIGIIGIVVICVLMAVNQKVKAAERKKYYRAAYRIIREQYLDGAIRNAENMGNTRDRRRLMIALKVKGNKGMGYVFDPSREINIGRGMENNDICLQDLSVSSNHCKIFLYEDRLCIKDMDSANGTVIKAKWKSSEQLHGNMGFLENKSQILVGSTCFLVTVFYCEMIPE